MANWPSLPNHSIRTNTPIKENIVKGCIPEPMKSSPFGNENMDNEKISLR